LSTIIIKDLGGEEAKRLGAQGGPASRAQSGGDLMSTNKPAATVETGQHSLANTGMYADVLMVNKDPLPDVAVLTNPQCDPN
jgi:hypothetical protein